MNNQDVETLYYFLNYYYINNNQEKSKHFAKILKPIYLEDRDQFKCLYPEKIRRLNIMIKSITDNLPVYNVILNEFSSFNKSISFGSNVEIKEEEDLKREIINNEDKISKLLNMDIRLYGIEFPTKYGDCDLVFKGENSIVVIELKNDEADHSILGQVLKYGKYFLEKTSMKHWDYVYGITIAKKYNQYNLSQIKSCNILPIQWSKSKDLITLQII